MKGKVEFPCLRVLENYPGEMLEKIDEVMANAGRVLIEQNVAE